MKGSLYPEAITAAGFKALGIQDGDTKKIDASLLGGSGGSSAIDWANPVVVDSTYESMYLESGKHHIIQDLGTPADYTKFLPPAPTDGDLVSIEISANFTQLFSLVDDDHYGIDGSSSPRIMWAKETAILRFDEVGWKWTKIAGKSVPYYFKAKLGDFFTVSAGVVTKLPLATVIENLIPSAWNGENNRVILPRTSRYFGTSYCPADGSNVASCFWEHAVVVGGAWLAYADTDMVAGGVSSQNAAAIFNAGAGSAVEQWIYYSAGAARVFNTAYIEVKELPIW